MKEYFRWRTIIALFVAPMTGCLGLFFFLAVCASVILKLVAFIFQPPFLQYEYYTNLLLFLPILTLPVYHLFLILSTWYDERRDFTEPEHIIILLVVAIYSSMIFGAINYGLYRVNNSFFSVDETIAKSEYKKYLLSQQQRIEESKRVVEGSKKLISELMKLERTSFTKSSYSYWPNPRKYTFDTNIQGVSIYFVEFTESETPVTHYSVEADVWGQKIVINPEAQIKALDLRPFMKDQITRDDLVKVFQYQAEWEYSNIILPLEKQLKSVQESGDAAFSVPMTLFVYQAAMDALGASPKYFNPSSFLTRLMAFLYAFLKYIYFGVFVSVVAKRFTSPTTKGNDEGSDANVPIAAEVKP